MSTHLKKDHVVEIIAGEHKGDTGKVLRVIPAKQLVVVEGVNMVHRHVRPSRRNPQGGRIQKEAPIHVSNVLPIDPKTNRGTRVRFEGQGQSKKRVTVNGTVLDEITTSQQ